MKKLSFVLLFLLFVLVIGAHADKRPENLLAYDQDVSYEGPFDTKGIFKRSERKKIWYPSKRFQTVRQIRCAEAYLALQEGTWTGNLGDNGQCLDPGEGKDWVTGNYLNFLRQKTIHKSSLNDNSED
ncbi:hypothetical protein SAMN02745165_02147 [Malonomonas rubra DSM 5091]|uniref:YARHG domain-containing protein n=1 Tax=Malonomonas rubra DSM 5091 TaxID=1122189 RepID=A0A1M6IKT5_MALRU|nr:hypothetical protein [Malonomonas rubra]SHJ35024.1 hypothetical protein SAMN02745165_02147 [Malonomonas rubra DSM 5091]